MFNRNLDALPCEVCPPSRSQSVTCSHASCPGSLSIFSLYFPFFSLVFRILAAPACAASSVSVQGTEIIPLGREVLSAPSSRGGGGLWETGCLGAQLFQCPIVAVVNSRFALSKFGMLGGGGFCKLEGPLGEETSACLSEEAFPWVAAPPF